MHIDATSGLLANAAANVPPARGAALHQIVVATILAAVLAAVLLWIAGALHARRLRRLRAVAAFGERATGLPAWAALPLAIGGASLLVAAFGFYWDVSWHIDRGRDPGPFANPAHWFIIAGLAGIAVAGLASVALGSERTATSVRLWRGWDAPLGGLLVLVCGSIALAGFPLDDIWHALFGQDVTLWGPTHIQMIGGASLATLALWVLLEEARRVGRRGAREASHPRWIRHGDVLLGGAFLIGLSTLQGEFDYGVPQFRQLYHPVLIMLAAGIGLVAVRVRAGRGGALGAAAFYLAVRGALTLMIGPWLGRSTLHFPLYLVEAGLVEGVAAAIGTARSVRFALASGAAIGTVGLAAEWGWSHVWMPLPWTGALWPSGALLGIAAALSGALVGAAIGRSLLPPGAGRLPLGRPLSVAATAVAVFCIAFPLHMSARTELTADVTLSPARAAGPGWVDATVRLSPAAAAAASSANWLNVTAWQGAGPGPGGLLLDPLVHVGGAVYRTAEPFPVFGNWKALLRLHAGSTMQAVPMYLPADPAIPAPQVAAFPHFRRAFEADKRILQREAVGGSVWLERVAYVLLLAIAVVWIGSLAWGLRRLDRTADLAPPVEPGTRARAA